MIERLLVANRGEIARRIMRTCRHLGIETVAVYSDADADAALVRDADMSVGLGGDSPSESYLRVDAVIDAAHRTGADAVHPGYGFLAESAPFARAVSDAGLVFVGPRADVIAAMGSKLEAKRLMAAAGVPLLPSAVLTGLDDDACAAAAAEVGYPLLVKASAGGGGRGMRVVGSADQLPDAVESASREAASAFGDGTVFAERHVAPSRHVEVQILGDDSGRVVHLHERDCSIQRRHQKIIEEAPAPTISDATRTALHGAAVRAGEAIGYTNAGTVEFLLAPSPGGGPEEFYFLEVNTRLQVEHPVTEAVLGVDLVELQLRVAAGKDVPPQDEIGSPNGHAVEARLYAEDPTADFLPSSGIVHAFSVPGDVRVDSILDNPSGAASDEVVTGPAAETAGVVPRFYDPMIAKVIAHAPTREDAARKLAASLAGATVDGIRTNRDLLVRTLRHPEFLTGRGDSSFLERHSPSELGRPLVEGAERACHAAAAALALQALHRGSDDHTGSVSTGFRNVPSAPQRVSLVDRDAGGSDGAAGSDDAGEHAVEYRFTRNRLTHLSVDGEALDGAVAHDITPHCVDLSVGGIRRLVDVRITPGSVSVTGPGGGSVFGVVPRFVEPEDTLDPGSTVASMPGTVVAVHVVEGDAVEVGDVLVVMEAMKMELAVTATTSGVVTSVPVEVGATVGAGTVLAVVEEAGGR